MSNETPSATYREPNSEFEWWVDRVAAGVQCVKNGILDTFFIEIDGDSGIIVESENVDYEIGRIMFMAQDLGISVQYQRGLDEPYTHSTRPVDYEADFGDQIASFREQLELNG